MVDRWLPLLPGLQAASMALFPLMVLIRTWVRNALVSLLAMGSLNFLLINSRICSALKCPSSCSNISPLPYPFGAIAGCGSPGFLMTNCSVSPPQWNLTLGSTIQSYYIKSINASPNVTGNTDTGTNNSSYGYGGLVLLYPMQSVNVTPFCQINTYVHPINNFTVQNLYAFEYANLSYYQDRFLFLNCSATNVSGSPDSGVVTRASATCRMYVDYCGSSTVESCMEYVPDKEFQLAALMRTCKCSSFHRWVIPDEDSPISAWIPATLQLVWGPVRDADSCSGCQISGGTCGYNTDDNNSFRCYCGDETYTTDCRKKSAGRLKKIAVGVSVIATVLVVVSAVACYYRYEICHYRSAFTNRKRLNLDGINQAPLEMPYWSLSAATKAFNTKIGQGAFGRVYRGVLYDGSEVAVKVLDSSVAHADEPFLNEVATVGNIHHVNVARLVGYCFRKSSRILVYEYVSNGSLDRYLFPKKKQQARDMHVPLLSWKQRFHIALGVARGLAYMHEECRSCIIHCDIKPQNILLDSAFCPKIADFGLARLLNREESRVLTHARGTPGYVAPEFWSLGSGPLSAKFDVYSYGMVLLEIIRGRKSFEEFDPFGSGVPEKEMDSFFSVSMDERIQDEADLDEVGMCTRVALWCIQEDPSKRPSMSSVVQYLQRMVLVPDNPPRPLQAVL